jgi:hypothetical protein
MSNDDDSKDIEKAGGLLPEVFFDLIGRVMPGSIFLGLYGSPFIPIPEPEKDLVVVFIAGYLLAAYLFGFAIDVAISFIFEFLGKFEILKHFDDSPRTKWIRALKPYNRSVAVKMVAEDVLFRSCIAIAGITAILPPNLALKAALPGCPIIYSIVAIILGLIGCYQIRKDLNDWRFNGPNT